MADGKDCILGGDEREEWDRIWGTRTQRSLPGECKLDFGADWRSLKVRSATIADNPPEFAARVWRASENCPVCGETTTGCVRVAASLEVTFEELGVGLARGFGYFVGVWVHQSCFDCCPDTGRPASIPW
jgi:hypothetical protein